MKNIIILLHLISIFSKMKAQTYTIESGKILDEFNYSEIVDDGQVIYNLAIWEKYENGKALLIPQTSTKVLLFQSHKDLDDMLFHGEFPNLYDDGYGFEKRSLYKNIDNSWKEFEVELFDELNLRIQDFENEENYKKISNKINAYPIKRRFIFYENLGVTIGQFLKNKYNLSWKVEIHYHDLNPTWIPLLIDSDGKEINIWKILHEEIIKKKFNLKSMIDFIKLELVR